MLWLGRDRPRAMRRRGRDVVPLDEAENVYLRWFNNWFDDEGALRPAMVAIPDQSMNRSGLGGRYWHVLIPDPGMERSVFRKWLCRGVVESTAANCCIVVDVESDEYRFCVEHDPLEHNYGHCELRVYKNGTRITDADAGSLRGAEKRAG